MGRNVVSPGELKRRNEMFIQGFLWCSECKQFKAAKLFYKVKSAKSKSQPTNYGYRHYCTECENTRKRNKPQKREYFKNKNSALKRQFVDLAGGCCQRCGFSEFLTAMDFHHVYPAEKKYSPTAVLYCNNFKRTWQELDKCCLLCATCHAAYTGNEWRAEFIKRDSLGWAVGDSLPLDDRRYEGKPGVYTQAAIPFELPKMGEQLGFWG